ncbi:MAG TPA: hypothetical protein VH934_08165 [Xanthobacteraceae bacterium]
MPLDGAAGDDMADASTSHSRQSETAGESQNRSSGTAKEQFAETAQRTQAQLNEDLGPAKRKAKDLAEENKAAGADKLKDVAQAIDSAAGQLEGEMPMAATAIRDVAAGLEQVSTKLKNQSVDDLASQVGSFARSQPVAFFAGAVLTGFVLSRFLKSSPVKGA